MRTCSFIMIVFTVILPVFGQSPLLLEGKIAFEVKNLNVPESFQYDPDTGKYFISNIVGKPGEKDGKGYILRLDENGKVEKEIFADGLNAPKGIAIFQGIIYVTDIDAVKGFDAKSGKLVFMSQIRKARFLNDITAANDCLYISDTAGRSIYRLDPGLKKIKLYCKTGKNRPNGLAVHPKTGELTVVCWAPGKIYRVKNGKLKLAVKKNFKNLDGAAYDAKGNLYVSDYTKGKVYRVCKGKVTVIAKNITSPADISLTPDNLLLIPCFEAKSAFAVKLND